MAEHLNIWYFRKGGKHLQVFLFYSWYFDFEIINIENTVSHKYVTKNGRSMFRAIAERIGNSVLILIQIHLVIFCETKLSYSNCNFHYTCFSWGRLPMPWCGTHMKVRGQLWGVDSLLLPCGSQEWNPAPHAGSKNLCWRSLTQMVLLKVSILTQSHATTHTLVLPCWGMRVGKY